MAKIKKWETVGAIFSIVAGSLLHFVFAWSQNFKPIALIAAVNESTWEHLKLAFWPTLIFSMVEYFVIARGMKNFCLATAVKLLTMPIAIVVLFYGWLLFFQDSFIWDISIFIFAVILGYYLSYKILKIEKLLNLEIVSAILITLAILAFSLLTYFPLGGQLFKDPISGGYGIIK